MRKLSTVVGVFLLAGNAEAAVVPGEVLARIHDDLPGTSLEVAYLSPPWVEGEGVPLVHGEFDDGSGFISRDGTLLWHTADGPAALEGLALGPATAAIDGGFAHDVLWDGQFGIWTDDGLFAANGVAAPGLASPVGVMPTNPRMAEDGSLFWKFRNASASYFMRSDTGLAADAEIMLQTGDAVGTETIRDHPDGIVRLQISPNGVHTIGYVQVENGASWRNWIWSDGALVTGTGFGEDWFTFDDFAIDDAGHYAIAGRLSGGADAAVVVDGAGTIEEGDIVGGLTLTAPADVDTVSMDSAGRVAAVWEYAGGDGVAIVVSCDLDDPLGSARVVLRDGDELDVDGDHVGDRDLGQVNDSFMRTTRFLGPDGTVLAHVQVDGQPAVVRLGPACCDAGVACCGNGVLDPAEACDDGDADAGDECTTSCALPVCGDGHTHADIEECDDGNDDDDDACANDCTANPVDGTTGGDTSASGSASDSSDSASGSDSDSSDSDSDSDPSASSSASASGSSGSSGSSDSDSDSDSHSDATSTSDSDSASPSGSDTDSAETATSGGSASGGDSGCRIGASPAPLALLLPLLGFSGRRRRRRRPDTTHGRARR